MAVISDTASEKDVKLIEEMVKKESGKNAIFLDGKVEGTIDEPGEFVKKIREKRRFGMISPFINVVWVPEFEEVHINADSGRLQRPLIIVENGKSKLTEIQLLNIWI